MSRLEALLTAARTEVSRRRELEPEEALQARMPDRRGAPSLLDALRATGLSLIAEFKRASPSVGEIRPGAEVAEIVDAYERGGARALSVLTEPSRFGGSLADLREARAASTLPVLRKDFTVDPYQVWEAAADGADAVLLIVAALADEELARLQEEARQVGLDCLVEVHDEGELERALRLGADPIGINNRDLRSFEVDTATALRLLAEVPPGVSVVAESGYTTRIQLDELQGAGAAGVLIGETLMRAADPAALVRELTTPSAPA